VDERQCIEGAHPQGALQTLQTKITDGVTKADVVAIIGDEAEHRWREIKKEASVKAEVVANYELFKKIQTNENNAVGEVMMDNGQEEQEEMEKVEQRKERDGKHSESNKCKDARAEQQKSKRSM
jgi:hypothetical protein